MKTEKTHTPSIVLIVRKGDPLTIITSALTEEGFAWCETTAEALAPQIRALGKAVMQLLEEEASE